MKIQHSLSFQFLVLVSLGLLTTNLYAEDDVDDAKPSITVTGTAEIRVVPDEAVLTFSVESREEKLDDAVKDNDEKIKAVTDFLSQSKIEPVNIRTQVINIQPIFEQQDDQWKGQIAPMPMPPTNSAPTDKKQKIKPIGYTARRGLSITITDLKSFETIYRGLIERGVNDVGGVEFRTTELRKYRDQARLSAVRAAREKATAMAGELGATLSSVQSIAEESGYGSNNYMSQNTFATAVMSDDSGSVAAGMIEINASVRVVFLLGETGLHK